MKHEQLPLINSKEGSLRFHLHMNTRTLKDQKIILMVAHVLI